MILVSFLVLGVVLHFSPQEPLAIWIGSGAGLAAFLLLRWWKPLFALTACIILFTLGALFSFMAGSDRAIPVLGIAGLVVAIIHHNALVWLDVAEKKTRIDLNRDGLIGLPQSTDEKRDAALRYVFSATGRNGDTFKRRIARENLTLMGYLSQREWREWVSELEQAGVIQCLNAQVTKPLVMGYESAREKYESSQEPVVLEPHPDTPQRMVRK